MRRLMLLPAAMTMMAASAWAQGDQGTSLPTNAPPNAHDWRWNHGWGPHHHGGSHLFFAFFVILLIFLALRWAFWGYRYRRFGGWHPYGYWPDGGALGILEERFARGEINKEEFEDKRKMLRQGRF